MVGLENGLCHIPFLLLLTCGLAITFFKGVIVGNGTDACGMPTRFMECVVVVVMMVVVVVAGVVVVVDVVMLVVIDCESFIITGGCSRPWRRPC